jgi:hypothetical protein
VFQVDFEIWLDQPVLDKAPHDPRHLVATEFDDRLRHFDLCHASHPRTRAARAADRRSWRAEDRDRGAARQAGKGDQGPRRAVPSRICAQRRRAGRRYPRIGDVTPLLPKVYTPIIRYAERFAVSPAKSIPYTLAYFLGKSLDALRCRGANGTVGRFCTRLSTVGGDFAAGENSRFAHIGQSCRDQALRLGSALRLLEFAHQRRNTRHHLE